MEHLRPRGIVPHIGHRKATVGFFQSSICPPCVITSINLCYQKQGLALTWVPSLLACSMCVYGEGAMQDILISPKISALGSLYPQRGYSPVAVTTPLAQSRTGSSVFPPERGIRNQEIVVSLISVDPKHWF